MVKINKLKTINNKNDVWLSFLSEASVKHGNQDYFGAIADLTKAININNKYPIPFIRRAYLRFEIKHYKNAKEDLTKAFKLNKKCPINKRCSEICLVRAYLLSALINKNLEKIQYSILDLEKAINIINNSRSKFWFGEIRELYEKKGDFLRELNRYEEAILSYTKAMIRSNRVNPRIHRKRGWLYYHISNYSKAINDFSIGIRQAKQIDKYHHFMARGFSFIGIKKPEKGLDDFKNALDHNPLAIEFYKDFFINFIPKEICNLVVVYFGINLDRSNKKLNK